MPVHKACITFWQIQMTIHIEIKFWVVKSEVCFHSASSSFISKDEGEFLKNSSYNSFKVKHSLVMRAWADVERKSSTFMTFSIQYFVFQMVTLLLTGSLKNAVWCMRSYGEWIFSASVWFDYVTILSRSKRLPASTPSFHSHKGLPRQLSV